MKKKKTFALGAALLSLAAISFGGLAGAVTGAEVVEGEAYTFSEDLTWYDIANAQEFIAAAQGGWTAGNYRLTADIDLGGTGTSGLCTSGSFSGNFDGQGYTVSNFRSDDRAAGIFYTVNEGAVIANATFEYEVAINDSASGIVYSNSGTIIDCTAVVTVPIAINTYAAFAFVSYDSAVYENLATHYFFEDNGVSSNTLYAVYNSTSYSGTVTNCTYTVSGVDTVTDNLLKDMNNLTLATGVAWVGLSGEDTVAVGSSIDLTTKIAGDSTGAEASWSVDDSSKASISNGSVSGATITGVESGEVTVTVTVGGVSASKTITVEAAATVSAVKISTNELSVEKGLTADVTITLTGNAYQSIAWTSADDTYVSVDGTDTGATITGVEITNQPVAVTVTVYGDEGDTLATDSVYVTVTEAIGFNVAVLVPVYPQAGPQTDVETAYVYVGGGTSSGYAAIERVKAGDTAVEIYYEGEAYYIFEGFISVSTYGIADYGTTYNVAFNHTESGLWGGVMTPQNYADGEWSDFIFAAPTRGDQNNTLVEGDVEDLDAAIEHVSATLYGTDTWRDEDESICWYVEGTHNTELNSLLSAYDGLDSNVKAWADLFIDQISTTTDSQDGYNITTYNLVVNYGETIAMLMANATNTDGTYTANASSSIGLFGDMDASLMIAMIVLVGAVAVLGIGGLIVYKRRHNEA